MVRKANFLIREKNFESKNIQFLAVIKFFERSRLYIDIYIFPNSGYIIYEIFLKKLSKAVK